MTYLSKIPLNPLRRATQRLLTNPQRIHAHVVGGLATQPVDERVLWRMERRQHACELLVLTQSRPSWAALVEEAGWPGADGGDALVRDYRPLLDRVALDREFAFKVVTNPAASMRNPGAPTPGQKITMASERTRGIRVGHRTAATQLAWLLARAAGDATRWGFTVGSPNEPNVELVAREHLSFRKGDGRAPVTLETATFEGVLRVTDVDGTRATLLGGLGGGKAYGCGLLTLAPSKGAGHVVAG